MKNIKMILKIIGLFLLIIIFIIVIPIIISYVITTNSSDEEGYLIVGASFLNYWGFLLIATTLCFSLKQILKFRKTKNLKPNKSEVVLTVVFIAISVIISSILFYRGHLYIKDIEEGPQECIMTDAIIKREHTVKNSHKYKINGYIDGKKVKIKLTQHTKNDYQKERNKEYSKLKIVYYKNINEVYKYEKYK